MVASLEREELVDRRACLGVVRRDAHDAAAWQIGHGVCDDVALGRHDGGAGHVPHVHEHRRREVTLAESARNHMEVESDHGDTGRVVRVAFELDATTVGEVGKVVRRGVLVDAHRVSAACLHRVIRAVVAGGRIVQGARLGPQRCGSDEEREQRKTSMCLDNWRHAI